MPMMPLKPAASALLESLPRTVRTCEHVYKVVLALADMGLVVMSERAVLGNGQVRYLVRLRDQRRPVVTLSAPPALPYASLAPLRIWYRLNLYGFQAGQNRRGN